jgi:DNA end-binding protein Ku
LKIAEVSCPVALFTAISASERIAFHTLNRKTGHRVKRQYVDAETGSPVDTEDQVKGYERDDGEYVIFEPEEIAAAIPESDKTLQIQAFLACDALDDIFLDRPYYLAPSSVAAAEGFALLREGMRAKKVAALARTVLFRRMHSLLIWPHDRGLIATTLNFEYEVRSPKEAFRAIEDIKIDAEMLELATHIIKTKTGTFDPSQFDDRYEAALAELVKAKLAGRKIKPPKPQSSTKVTNLLDRLRESAGQMPASKKKPRRAAVAKRKAG